MSLNSLNKIMDKRTVEVSLAKAREWYKSGNKSLKEVALQAFTKEELEGTDWKSITSFEDACDALGLSRKDELANVKTLNAISAHAAAIYKLDIVCKALNGGEIPSLISDNIYYPWVRFYHYDKTPSTSDLNRNNWVLGDEFEHAGKSFILVGGDYNYYYGCGVGNFCRGGGNASAYAGLLCCKSREIAQHMSRHFGRLIFDAVYSQYDFVDWED